MSQTTQMKESHLHLVEAPVSHAPRAPLRAEESNYSEGSLTNGYGQASGVYATVTKGAKVSVDVDFTITTLSEENFTQWKKKTSQNFTQEQHQTLEDNYAGGGLIGSYIAGAFGILFGGGDHNHYRNTTSTFKAQSGSSNEGFLQTVHNLKTSQFRVHGSMELEGTSNIPAKAAVYVQVTKIKFADGTELHVIDTDNPVAAGPDGSTGNATVTGGKLNVTSL